MGGYNVFDRGDGTKKSSKRFLSAIKRAASSRSHHHSYSSSACLSNEDARAKGMLSHMAKCQWMRIKAKLSIPTPSWACKEIRMRPTTSSGIGCSLIREHTTRSCLSK
uniref:Uncharacterized protein n=1 Tax=Oryza nivara TaxID=4536 RepID=A0A0E0GXZ9_ORYNI